VQPLLTLDGNAFIDARAWAPDGQSLLVSYGHPNEVSAGRLSMTADGNGTHDWVPLVERAGGAWVGGVSPDGKWIALESASSGQREIHVEHYPELGGRRPVSVDGGTNVIWSPDGRELFYRRPRDGAMMVVRVTTTPDLTIGLPEVLFPVDASLRRIPSSRSWDLAPDGRFLMVKAGTTELPPESRSLHLVQGWSDELRRLVPTD
jgi:hypothetical protein